MRARWLLALLLVGCTTTPDGGDDDDASDYDPGCLPAGVDPAMEPRRATVRWNVDGDTAGFEIDGLGRESVRFLSVDTTETASNGRPADCYANEAKAITEERLAPGTEVWLTFGPELRDGFGRILAYIHLGETPSCTDYDDWVNLAMVSEGSGCEFVWGNNENWLDLFRAAEAEAREEDRGLWGRCRDAAELCR